VKGASKYSNTWNPVKINPRKIVRAKEKIASPLFPAVMAW